MSQKIMIQVVFYEGKPVAIQPPNSPVLEGYSALNFIDMNTHEKFVRAYQTAFNELEEARKKLKELEDFNDDEPTDWDGGLG